MGEVRSIDSAPTKVPRELEGLTPQELEEVRLAGYRFALRLTKRHEADAKELVQEAWVALLTTRPWDRSQATLPIWFCELIDGYARHLFRDRPNQAKRQDKAIQGAIQAGFVALSTPSPEAQLLALEGAVERTATKKQRLEMLMLRIDKDPECKGVLEGVTEGKTREQIAQELGITSEQVRLAWRRILYHVETISKELEANAQA